MVPGLDVWRLEDLAPALDTMLASDGAFVTTLVRFLAAPSPSLSRDAIPIVQKPMFAYSTLGCLWSGLAIANCQELAAMGCSRAKNSPSLGLTKAQG